MSSLLLWLAACELVEDTPPEGGSFETDARAAHDAGAELPWDAEPSTAPPDAAAIKDGDANATRDAGAMGTLDARAMGDARTDPQSDGGDGGRRDASGDAASLGAFPFPPFETTGTPLAAPDRTWTYVEFAGAKCRDGSAAGIALNLNKASKKVLIYLEGAAYCFDDITCFLNADKVDDGLYNWAKGGPSAGIFDLQNARNPVRDWNIIYVPNCTGDGQGGTKASATDVPGGPSGQFFVGQLNLQQYLQRVVPTFPDVSDVLLAGISSGGFGVLQSLVLVQRAFPKLAVRYVNDSNPPLSKTVVAPCLQDKMRTLWGLDHGAIAYCGENCPNPRDYLEDNAIYLAKLLADRPGGYIEALEDSLMMAVFGLGNNECTGSFLEDSIPEATFRSALLTYRDKLKGLPNYGTFFPEATDHTWLSNDNFYTISAGGVSLVDWFAKIAKGEPPGHAGPP